MTSDLNETHLLKVGEVRDLKTIITRVDKTFTHKTIVEEESI